MGPPGLQGAAGAGTAATTPFAELVFMFDGGGAVPAANSKQDITVNFACIITRATLVSDVAGSAVVDVWAAPFSTSTPPVVGNTITAAALPTLSSQTGYDDSTLTGWTKPVAAGTTLRANLNSAATLTKAVLTLTVIPYSYTVPRAVELSFVFDGNGSPPAVNSKQDVTLNFACLITRATLLSDISGSIVVDVWAKAFSTSSPPTVANTIAAAALPTLSSATGQDNTTLTGWTTLVPAGTTLRANVNSASTLTRAILTLTVIPYTLPRTIALVFVFDGGGAAPAANSIQDLTVNFACTIIRATLTSDVSGSCVIDVWAAAFSASTPPAVGNTITGSSLPTLSSAAGSDDQVLSGWKTSIAAGTTLRANINSALTLNRVVLTLTATVP
jgi:hypothetical protein